jgi:hypothetical protein
MSATAFVSKYHDLCQRLDCLQIMDKIPLSDASTVVYAEPARYETFDDDFCHNIVEVTESIQPGEACLLGKIELDDNDYAVVATYVYATQMKVLTEDVSSTHWVNGCGIKLDDIIIDIECENMRDVRHCVFCDSYTLTPRDGKLPPVTITDTIAFDGRYIIPSGAYNDDGTVKHEALWSATLQDESFSDEWSGYNESNHESYVDELCDFINAHSATSPELALKNLLSKSPGYLTNLLKGGNFSVKCTDKGKWEVVAA